MIQIFIMPAGPFSIQEDRFIGNTILGSVLMEWEGGSRQNKRYKSPFTKIITGQRRIDRWYRHSPILASHVQQLEKGEPYG